MKSGVRGWIVAASGIAVSACGGDTAAPTEAADSAHAMQVLAEYPSPTFLENLFVHEGAVFFTNYTAKTIDRIDPEGVVSTFASLDAHPVSLARRGEGWLVVAHQVGFTVGEGYLGSGVLVELDADGTPLGQVAIPNVAFANGVLAVGERYLIADSVNGAIMVYDPASQAIATWLADDALKPAFEPYFEPGANGLKRNGQAVLVSASRDRTIYRIALDDDLNPAGGLEPFLPDLPGADDFAVASDGAVVVATHGDAVVTVAIDGGEVTTLSADGAVRGSTAVAIIGDGAQRRVIALGTGGYSEGGDGAAAVVSLAWPEAR